MLTFRNVLTHEGVDPKRVRLARHKDTRGDALRSAYDLWKAQDGSFERYQCIQRDPVFPINDLVASFVVPPTGETLFVGLFNITSEGRAPRGTLDPLTSQDVAGLRLYQMPADKHMQDYIGRLVIDWGEGFRTWIQKAESRKEKRVIELRTKFEEPGFPGYSAFIKRLSEIERIPRTWIEPLRSVRGVYLLTCPKTKEQYVGSASGEYGFWDRWRSYIHSGHGGNVALKSREPSDYQVSILEVVGSATTQPELLAIEQRWKDKLQSREMGLNRN